MIASLLILITGCDVVFGLRDRPPPQDCERPCAAEIDCPTAFFCSTSEGFCRTGASLSACVEVRGDAGFEDPDASIVTDPDAGDAGGGTCTQPATCDLFTQLGCCPGTGCYLDPSNPMGASCKPKGASTTSCPPGGQNVCVPGRVCAASACYFACDTSKPNTCFGTQLCHPVDSFDHGFCQ